MSKKTVKGVLYSTDPNFQIEYVNDTQATLDHKDQVLKVWLDTKNRGGKKATIVKGFVGNSEDLTDLAKSIKTKLGVGGSAKDGEIIIQGDYVLKVKDILVKLGFGNVK